MISLKYISVTLKITVLIIENTSNTNRIGTKELKERAIPVGTPSGILIFNLSIVINLVNNSTDKIEIIIATNKPCALILVELTPLVIMSSIPSTTVTIDWGIIVRNETRPTKAVKFSSILFRCPKIFPIRKAKAIDIVDIVA